MATLRWGIIGTGWVSENFSTDLIKFSPFNETGITHVVTAVGSSSIEKANKFVSGTLEPLIEKIGIDHPSITASAYDDVYTNPDVDIIYVGSPHVNHLENTLKAFDGGKHVLCEKPVTVTAKQAKKIIDTAEEKNLFFMEALWVRFFPANRTLVKQIYGTEKVLGDVKKVTAKYSYVLAEKFDVTPEHRLVNKKLAGGAMLDIGVYPLTYLRMYLDPLLDPITDWNITRSEIVLDSVTGKDDDRVDYSASASFDLPKYGQEGEIFAGYYGGTLEYEHCVIEGTKGTARIRHAGLPGTWEYTIEIDGEKKVSKFENPVPDSLGFYFQAAAVGQAIAKGEKETAIAPWSDSIAEMTIADKIRQDNGFYYAEDFQ